METTISSDEERIDSESVINLVLPLQTQKKKRKMRIKLQQLKNGGEKKSKEHQENHTKTAKGILFKQIKGKNCSVVAPLSGMIFSQMKIKIFCKLL